MARRDSNSDTGKSRSNTTREGRMHDVPARLTGPRSVQDDAAELNVLSDTRGAADIAASPKTRR